MKLCLQRTVDFESCLAGRVGPLSGVVLQGPGRQSRPVAAPQPFKPLRGPLVAQVLAGKPVGRSAHVLMLCSLCLVLCSLVLGPSRAQGLTANLSAGF